jgi:hypothetical protein
MGNPADLEFVRKSAGQQNTGRTPGERREAALWDIPVLGAALDERSITLFWCPAISSASTQSRSLSASAHALFENLRLALGLLCLSLERKSNDCSCSIDTFVAADCLGIRGTDCLQ